MNLFRRSSAPTELTSGSLSLRHKLREPGHGTSPEEVFEVWGDLLDCTWLDREGLAGLGTRAVAFMYERMRELLDLADDRRTGVTISLCSDPEGAHYLIVEWQDMRGEIGARPFGRCLDIFGMLMLSTRFAADPNPLVRLAKLTASQRRDVELFQTLLKYVLERTMEAFDEHRIA